MVNPLSEIGLRWRIVVLDVVIETLETILGVKIIQAILERVLYIPVFIENLVISAGAMNIAAQERHHVIDHRLVAGEDDVGSAGIVSEAVLLDGEAMPAAAGLFFENFAILLQVGGDADAGQPCA